ncbi:MAG: PatB family C-S lyase [Thermodesulfobacteriota bacterium]|nr:PatB family C-S lyase [Thermodesulfobacteriota bacterium]
MACDFDRIIERRDTDSIKWNQDVVEVLFNNRDAIPMWVADMDFEIAKPIQDAISKRAQHPVYGYATPGSSVIEAIVDRMKRLYGWEIRPEWIVFTPGVVPALYAAVRAYTHPGDGVVMQSPVYYPFWSAIRDNGCIPLDNELVLKDKHYEIDFDDLEYRFQNSPFTGIVPQSARAKMMILCSPHNPGGRVWTSQELERIGEICLKNNAIMVSDEIHCDLIFKGHTHTPFAAISREFEDNSVVLVSPSKTFNLAGLGTSVAIIPDPGLKKAFTNQTNGIMPMANPFGLAALEAAYRYGDEWLEELMAYLEKSLDFLMAYFAQRIPDITPIRPEGTYLVWLDCSRLGMDDETLKRFFMEKCGLGLDNGPIFGPSGSGFQRINIACPRSRLEQALEGIEKAIKDL